MKKNSKKRKFRLKSICMMCFVIYAVYALVNQQIMIHQLSKVKEQKIQEINVVVSDNEKLKQMIKTSNSDAYIERMAREQLGLVKPGEKVYIDTNMQDDSK